VKYFGAHLSAVGSYVSALEQAIALNINAVQVFFHPPTSGKIRKATDEEAAEFASLVEKHDLKVYIHMPYVFNTCHHQKIGWAKKSFSDTIRQAIQMKVTGIVWHPGSHKDDSTMEKGIQIFQSFIEYLLKKTEGKVLLLPENTAGLGTAIGNDLDRLLRIMDPFPTDQVKMTLDYAHSWATGSNWEDSKTATDLLKKAGDRIGLIHCNNNPTPLGSHRDIHSSICEDNSITSVALKEVIKTFAHVPHVLERSVGAPEDELEVLAQA